MKNPHRTLTGLLPLIFLVGCPLDRAAPLQVVGTLEWDRVELSAETPEPILEILVREGDRVQAGQVLLRQDPRKLEAQWAAAAATQRQASARLAELLRGARRERIESAQARLRAGEEVLVVRQANLDRIGPLVSRKLATPDQQDNARAILDQARGERDAARAQLEELENGTTAEEITQAREALAVATATAKALEITVGRLTLVAPREGRLDSLPFQPGERPPNGAAVVILLTGPAYARVHIPEPIRVNINPGDRAQVRVDGLPEPLEGRVRWVSADPDFTPFYALTEQDRGRLSYLAKIDLPDPPRELPAGVPVRAVFPALASP
ncbi:MAG: HlyD family efflux transporter periplasmic adaptor subunit [Pseudomonadota bacterium]